MLAVLAAIAFAIAAFVAFAVAGASVLQVVGIVAIGLALLALHLFHPLTWPRGS